MNRPWKEETAAGNKSLEKAVRIRALTPVLARI
jgi:hypothetical protein